jgi:hypothetical protein
VAGSPGDALGEYNVSVPDVVHVNLVLARFNIQSFWRAIYRKY